MVKTMKWVKRTHNGFNSKWETIPVEVEEVTWDKVKYGDVVLIAGNLVDGKPTVLYGRHKVISPERQLLSNGTQEFFERWPTIFKYRGKL